MFTKSIGKKPPVIDSNYQVLKLDIEKSRILEEIFSEKFELKLNYKPEKLFDFTEVKEGLIRNFPNLERGVNLLERHFGQTNQLSSILMKDTLKSDSEAFERFINMIQRRINEQIDDFNEKVLSNKRFQNKKDEIPDQLNFKAFRKKLKEKIIHYSNDIIRVFAVSHSRPSKQRNEKDFVSVAEKIIRLYNFLKCDATVVTQHAALSSGLLLHSICAKVSRPIMEYITFNTKELKASLDKEMEKMYPIFMSKKEIVIRRLHDVIKDNDDLTELDYDFIARSIFHRDQQKLFREIYGKIEKAMKELEFEGQNEFIIRQEELKANIERSKIQIDQIVKNEFFERIRSGALLPERIRELEFNEANVKFIVALEKFILDLQKITTLVKDLMEQVFYFRQEEELYYKTKYFKIIRHIIEVMNHEREKFSIEHLIDGFFKKLKKTIEKQDHVEEEEEEIESKLMEELLKGKNNAFLKNTFIQMQEKEMARKRGEYKIKEEERRYNRREYENQIKELLESYDSDRDKKKRKKYKGRGSSSDSDKDNKATKKRELESLLQDTKKRYGDRPEYKLEDEKHKKKKKHKYDSSDDEKKNFIDKYKEMEEKERKRREREEERQNKDIKKLMNQLGKSSSEDINKRDRSSSDKKKKKKAKDRSSSSSSSRGKHERRRGRTSSSSSKDKSKKKHKHKHSSSHSKEKKKEKGHKSRSLAMNGNLTYSSDSSSRGRSKSKKKGKGKKDSSLHKRKSRSSSSSDKKKKRDHSSSSDKKKKRHHSSSADKKKRKHSSSSDKKEGRKHKLSSSSDKKDKKDKKHKRDHNSSSLKKKRGRSSSSEKKKKGRSSSSDKKDKKKKSRSSSSDKKKRGCSSSSEKGKRRKSSSSEKAKRKHGSSSDEGKKKNKTMKFSDLEKNKKKKDSSSSDKKKKKKRSDSSSSDKKKKKKSSSSDEKKKKKKEKDSSDENKKREVAGFGTNVLVQKQPEYKLTATGNMVTSNKLNFEKPNVLKKGDSSSDEKEKKKKIKLSSSDEDKKKKAKAQPPASNPLMVTSSGAVIKNNKIDFSSGLGKAKNSSSDEDKKKKALKLSSDEDKKKKKNKLSSDEEEKKKKKKLLSSDEDKKKKKLSSDEDKKKKNKKNSSDEDKKKKDKKVFKMDSDDDDKKKKGAGAFR